MATPSFCLAPAWQKDGFFWKRIFYKCMKSLLQMLVFQPRSLWSIQNPIPRLPAVISKNTVPTKLRLMPQQNHAMPSMFLWRRCLLASCCTNQRRTTRMTIPPGLNHLRKMAYMRNTFNFLRSPRLQTFELRTKGSAPSSAGDANGLVYWNGWKSPTSHSGFISEIYTLIETHTQPVRVLDMPEGISQQF
jgi:hypothetical protein